MNVYIYIYVFVYISLVYIYIYIYIYTYICSRGLLDVCRGPLQEGPRISGGLVGADDGIININIINIYIINSTNIKLK